MSENTYSLICSLGVFLKLLAVKFIYVHALRPGSNKGLYNNCLHAVQNNFITIK